MKKSMKNVMDLFKLDWQRIYHNKLTLILIIALMIIPSLYAWFNIAALWDPYSNTKDIAIGVYSDDKTVTIMDEKVNIGDKIIKNLKKNKTLGWRFVTSKKELDQGVKDGSLYASIYLPDNFSEHLISFVNGDIKKPKLEYTVNKKINAIASKITDKGAGTIQSTISTEFVDTVSETLLKVFNEVGYDIDSNMVSINKVSSKILAVDDNIDVIDGYTKEIVALNNKMPEMKGKLSKANEFMTFLPEVDAMGSKLLGLNNMMPAVRNSGKMLVTLQQKIPEIENAGRQINMIDNDFGQIVKVMNEAVDEANKGLVIIGQAQQVLPQVQQLAETANATIPQISASLGEIQNALPQIANGVGASVQLIVVVAQSIADTADQLTQMIGNHELTPTDKAAIGQALGQLNANLEFQKNMLGHLANTLTQLQQISGNNHLQPIIDRLHTNQQMIVALQNQVNAVIANINVISAEQVKAELQAISSQAKQVAGALAGIDANTIQTQVGQMLAGIQQMLASAQSITGKIVDGHLIQQLDALLTSTSKTIRQAIGFLQKYQKELPSIKQEIHSANQLLNGNMTLITSTINRSAYLYRHDLPLIEHKINQASGFIENDWPEVKKDLTGTMKLVNQKAPEVEKALNQATDMIENDWPSIKKNIHKVAGAVRKGQKDVDLKELVKLMKSDAKKESEFISNPVELSEKDMYEIPNYGSASAPFYTALCLWVGAVLFSSIASTEFYLTEEQQRKYSRRQQFLARMGTFLVMGLAQSIIVSLGNIFLLGAYTAQPVLNVLFSMLVGFTFMMMVYVLVALMGNLGKGIAVIILVLSISGGGGNFPIEMSGKFFQFINPFLPFTHAVNLIRESVGGAYWPNTAKDILIMVSVTLVFFIIGILFFPRVKAFFKRLNDKLHEGHLLH